MLVVFGLSTAALGFLLRSPFGHTLLAIRKRASGAIFGYSDRATYLARICRFVRVRQRCRRPQCVAKQLADPTMLNYTQSGEIVIMAVLGGMRSFWGPLLGAAIFVLLQDYLSSLTPNWMSFLGAVFMLMVLFFPRGVLGVILTKPAR